MAQRDYILRMIEQLGALLAGIRKRILGGEIEEAAARGELRDAARMGGLDYDLARAMTSQSLLLMVAPDGEVDPGRCWLLAELSYLDGLEADLAGRSEEAVRSLERAALLFGLLQPVAGNVVGLREALGRVEEVERLLAQISRD